MEKVYRYTNGRYEEIGIEWSGWPADGIWEVQDAKQQLLVKRDDIKMMPPFLPALKMKTDECTEYIMANLGSNYSTRQVAELAAEFYSRLVTEKEFPETFL